MSIIDTIREKHSTAVVPRCSEGDYCELVVNNSEPHLILKGELFRTSAQHRAADCVIFIEGNPLTLAVVELKSRTMDPYRVASQLKSSLIRALEALQMCKPEQRKCEIRLIVLATRWSPSVYRVIQNTRFKVNRKKCSIIPEKYEHSLAEILSEWSSGLCVGVGQAGEIEWSQRVKIVTQHTELARSQSIWAPLAHLLEE